MIEQLFLLGLACGYITRCLLLEQRDSHVGPFRIKGSFVKFDDGHLQPAALFDVIRMVAGVYRIEKVGLQQVLHVIPEAAERFTCPFCLSFWVALPASGWVFHAYQSLGLAFVSLFVIAVISTLTVGAIDYGLRMRS